MEGLPQLPAGSARVYCHLQQSCIHTAGAGKTLEKYER
ncbi:MAG: hypothetical protein RLZZ28_1425 [Bacteroidota bacterium]|jgi:hypothetical protein